VVVLELLLGGLLLAPGSGLPGVVPFPGERLPFEEAPGLLVPDEDDPRERWCDLGAFGSDVRFPPLLRLPEESGGFAPDGDDLEGGIVPGVVVDDGGDVDAPGVDDDDGVVPDGAAGVWAWAVAVARPSAPARNNTCNLSISETLELEPSARIESGVPG
jgi:hypothetical protein